MFKNFQSQHNYFCFERPVENMPNADRTRALITFTKVSTALTAEKEKDRRQLWQQL